MFQDIRKTFFIIIGVSIFILIGIFSYYEYRLYRRGPEITQINIKDYMTTSIPYMNIEASLSNTKKISINNKEINIIDRNNIENIVVFSPGNNIIEIILEDIFGKKKSYIYNIYYVSDEKHSYKTLTEIKEEEENNKLKEAIIEETFDKNINNE